MSAVIEKACFPFSFMSEILAWSEILINKNIFHSLKSHSRYSSVVHLFHRCLQWYFVAQNICLYFYRRLVGLKKKLETKRPGFKPQLCYLLCDLGKFTPVLPLLFPYVYNRKSNAFFSGLP